MRVAFFVYQPLSISGGVTTFVLQMCNMLGMYSKNITCDVITLENTSYRPIQILYALYFFTKSRMQRVDSKKEDAYKKLLGKSTYRKASFSGLSKMLREYDKVYVHNDILVLGMLFVLSLFSKLPPIITGIHSALFYPTKKSLASIFHNKLYGSFLYKLFLSKASVLHVLTWEDEKKLYGIFPNKPILRIPNPIIMPSRIKSNTRQEKRFRILWVGRLTEQKGAQMLTRIIEKFEIIQPKKIEWIIVGDGEEKRRVEALAKQYSNVRYKPFLSQKDLYELYLSISLFISTSLWEVYPYAMIEALSCGVPVISFAIPGMKEIIHAENGFLVEDRDMFVKKIAQTVEEYPFNNKQIAKEAEAMLSAKKLIKEYQMLFTV